MLAFICIFFFFFEVEKIAQSNIIRTVYDVNPKFYYAYICIFYWGFFFLLFIRAYFRINMMLPSAFRKTENVIYT